MKNNFDDIKENVYKRPNEPVNQNPQKRKRTLEEEKQDDYYFYDDDNISQVDGNDDRPYIIPHKRPPPAQIPSYEQQQQANMRAFNAQQNKNQPEWPNH